MSSTESKAVDTSTAAANEAVVFAASAKELIMKTIKNKNVSDVTDVVNLVVPLMKLAGKFVFMSGSQKKDAVIAILKSEILPLVPSEAVAPVQFAIENVIPPMIDQMYLLKSIDFKKCFSCCC
jgi:hypothetical protein